MLLTLFVVAGFIVVRAAFRRRYIRQHGMPPTPPPGQDPRDCVKPQIHDVYIHVGKNTGIAHNREKVGMAWEMIMPVTAAYIHTDELLSLNTKETVPDSDAAPVLLSMGSEGAAMTAPARFIRRPLRMGARSSVRADVRPNASGPVRVTDTTRVRAACIIAMPVPVPVPLPRSHEVPSVEIGVTEEDVSDPGDLKPDAERDDYK